MVAAAGLMIPTTWLADLSSLSYVGLMGFASTIILSGVIGYEYLVTPDRAGLIHTAALVRGTTQPYLETHSITYEVSEPNTSGFRYHRVASVFISQPS